MKDRKLDFWLACLQIGTGLTLGIGLAVISRVQSQYIVVGSEIQTVNPPFDLVAGMLTALLLFLFVGIAHCIIEADKLITTR